MFLLFAIGLAAFCIVWFFILGSMRPIFGSNKIRAWKTYLVVGYCVRDLVPGFVLENAAVLLL